MQSRYSLRSPAVKRLMNEAAELHQPTEQYHAQPLDDNLFEWHFTLRGPADSEFDGGIYHGRIVLPPDYPMKPPSIILLTPNGRFETNKKICLSISGYHPESWQPSWSIRTALLAIIGFMPTHGNGAIGSLDYTGDERKILAKRSHTWKCPECGDLHDLLPPVTGTSPEDEEAKKLAAQINFKAEKEKDTTTTTTIPQDTAPQPTTTSTQPPTQIPTTTTNNSINPQNATQYVSTESPVNNFPNANPYPQSFTNPQSYTNQQNFMNPQNPGMNPYFGPPFPPPFISPAIAAMFQQYPPYFGAAPFMPPTAFNSVGQFTQTTGNYNPNNIAQSVPGNFVQSVDNLGQDLVNRSMDSVSTGTVSSEIRSGQGSGSYELESRSSEVETGSDTQNDGIVNSSDGHTPDDVHNVEKSSPDVDINDTTRNPNNETDITTENNTSDNTPDETNANTENSDTTNTPNTTDTPLNDAPLNENTPTTIQDNATPTPNTTPNPTTEEAATNNFPRAAAILRQRLVRQPVITIANQNAELARTNRSTGCCSMMLMIVISVAITVLLFRRVYHMMY